MAALESTVEIDRTFFVTSCTTHRRLRLRYSEPVRDCVRLLWAAPPEVRSGQRVVQLRWRCTPEADAAREYVDDFGNRVIEIRHARIESEWDFTLELTTCRDSLNAPAQTNMPPQGLGAFLLPSARCDLAPAIVETAKQFANVADREACVASICKWTHGALHYDENADGELWTASGALERGAGVCADYAHLMIAVCRSLHIPARYIAGYNPAEGAMHAWCEALIGETWRAYDPTHARAARADCVFVAAGRDERDCPPFRGTFKGAARVHMDSRCRTKVLDPV